MKIFLVFVLAIFNCDQSSAAVNAFFPTDKAMFIIQGRDNDALDLYEAMNVPESNIGGKLSKNIKLSNLNADPILNLLCTVSGLTNAASCTLTIFPVSAYINKEESYVLMGINDRFLADEAAALFHHKTANMDVFRSFDESLRIWKTVDSDGKVVSLTAEFKKAS